MAARQTIRITKTKVTRNVKRGLPAIMSNMPKAPNSTSTGGGKKRGRPKGSKDKKPRKKRS